MKEPAPSPDKRTAPPVRWTMMGRRKTDKSPVSERMLAEESESREAQIRRTYMEDVN